MVTHKKHLLLLTGLFLSLISFSQEALNKTDASGKKQGRWVKYDENQKKVYDGKFVDGVPTGKFTYYYNNGEQRAVTIFSMNGKVARTKMYNVAGKLQAEGKYISEKKDSTWRFYDEEAVLLAEESYLDGKKNGPSKVFFRNGKVADERVWKDGKLNGPRVSYFDDGQVKYKSTYVNDKVEGKVTFYYDSGKIDAEGQYKNDLKDGVWKYYKEDGSPKRSDTYKDGTLTSKDENIITKEQLEKEKEKYKDFEIKNPFDGDYSPN